MQNDKKQYCSNCNKQVRYDPRYPKSICGDCKELLTDKNGRLVGFSNTEMLGFGCQGYYRNTERTEEYNTNIAYIGESSFEAKTHRFGGIAIQLLEKEARSLSSRNIDNSPVAIQDKIEHVEQIQSINDEVINKYLDYYIGFVTGFDEKDRIELAQEHLEYDLKSGLSVEEHVKNLFNNDNGSLTYFVLEYLDRGDFEVCSYYNDFVVDYFEGMNSDNYSAYENILSYAGMERTKLLVTKNIIWIMHKSINRNETNELVLDISADGVDIKDSVLKCANLDYLEISTIEKIPELYIAEFDDMNKLLLSLL